MGMDINEMKKGIKCFVDGPVDMINTYSKHISTYGIIEEPPIRGTTTAIVHVQKGLSGKSEIVRIPTACIYWTDQKKNIKFTD